MYNITDELTTDDNFVEGAGKTYPAGTNVVLVEPSAGVRKWDVLAGSVDLSAYVKSDDVKKTLLGSLNNKSIVEDVSITNDVCYVDRQVMQVNGEIVSIVSELYKFATDTEVGDAVQTELNKN